MSTAQVELAASALGDDLLAEVVFLGGSTIGLWLTDPAARAPRVTIDVDVVAVDVLTIGAYERFQDRLRARHFQEDSDAPVLCRWKQPERGLILDAIPAETRLAGIDDRWLADALPAARSRRLPSGTAIRAMPPEWLLVLKVSAFGDRGDDDVLLSP